MDRLDEVDNRFPQFCERAQYYTPKAVLSELKTLKYTHQSGQIIRLYKHSFSASQRTYILRIINTNSLLVGR
jgi:hypothetical protein